MSLASNSDETGGPPLHDALQKAGFRYADDMDDDFADRLREFSPTADSLSIRNVIEREIAGGRLLVGEFNLDNINQTIAFFASDVLKMPSFLLQPKSRSLYSKQLEHTICCQTATA